MFLTILYCMSYSLMLWLDIESLWSLLLSVLIAVLVMLLSIIFFKLKMKKNYSFSRIMQLPKHLKLDDSGAHITSETETVNLQWQDFKKAHEFKYAFYFIASSGYPIIIPLRLLDDDEYSMIQEIINKKFSEQRISS